MRRLTYIALIICVLSSLIFVASVGAAPALADRGEWAPYTSYTVGDTVTYNGCTYSVIQSHTSLPGWEPPNVPALFQLVSCGGGATNTNTAVPATATRTNTPAGATNTPTRTNTPAGPTNTPTRTNTPQAATNTPTRTNTPLSPTNTPTSSGSGCYPAWNSSTVYVGGDNASDAGHNYHANWWNQNDRPSTSNTGAWTDLGPCGGSSPTNTPTRTNTPVSATNTPSGPTLTPTRTPTSGGGGSCAVKSAPTGKVLQGYWESWDGSGVHPGMGHISLSQVPAAYNVIMAAFPVILSDGTAEWFDGMDVGVDVPTPQEVCDAKAAGHWVLLSIGGAAAGIDLSSTTVADRFIATIVPILQSNNFDGIDIDIESGLVAGASYNSLSTSQSNLIRIIDGILAQMPSNFMLTMAPETAYVTGGQIAYGGPWGAYLPIIGKYRDNGRLSWLNMQYYNGSMYGCPGGVATSYSAGTVQGFVEQTKCLNNGFQAGGVTFSLPYSKQVPGLPAQSGAGGGYMVPSDVTSAYNQVSSIKGLMTWSINWDGSKGWTFANNKPY